MRAHTLIACIGFLGLTVSCAHKQVDLGDQQAKADQKIEKKVETKEIAKDKELAYTCLVGQDRRLVTLDKKKERCEVSYTKYGDAQQVAWAESTPKICQDAFSSIRTNIEGAGYKCLDGSDAKFEDPKKQLKEEKKAVETAAVSTKTK